MPYQKNGVRNYRKEYDLYHSKPKNRKRIQKRVEARREMVKTHGKKALQGKDIDHKKKLSNGGSNSKSNLRVRNRSANRSDNGAKTRARKKK